MQIAVFAPLPPEKNGIANYARLFIDALVVNGVSVITPDTSAIELTTLEKARSFIRAFDWSGIDVCHFEVGGGRSKEFMLAQALKAELPSFPVSMTVHDPDRLVWRPHKLGWMFEWVKPYSITLYKFLVFLHNPMTLKAEQRLAQALDGLITLTTLGARALETRMKLPSNSVNVIPHANIGCLERSLSIQSLQPLKLLYFGFIYRGKGIEDLISAIHQLSEMRSNVGQSIQLTIAGGVEVETAFRQGSDYLSELKDMIEQYGLSELIKFNINIDDSGILDLIQQHDVMVLPYKESRKLAKIGSLRGTSGALSWAMAAGRGAITSDARAFSEEVSFGNGRVFHQGDVNQLARIIEELADNPSLAIKWSDAAYKKGQERCWDNVAVQFTGLFSSLKKGRNHEA